VTRIAGAVVGDESRFDQDRYPDAWPQRYLSGNETGPLTALSVNDAFERFPLRKGDGTPLLAAREPARYAAAVLTFALRTRGVEIVGEPRSGVAPADAIELVSVPSPPMREIVREMLSESDNSTAELLLKELGRTKRGAGTTTAGVDALADELAAADMPLGGVEIVDGSGLATQGRATCDLLTALLDAPDTGGALEAALPVAGKTGTLQKRFLGAVAGRMRAKTGTLDHVTALAGAIDPLQGGELTFSFIANLPADVKVSPLLIGSQEELAKILLAYPRLPDLTALGPKPLPDG
jgi:D-alanyl-D-alanine carboxypeptidase/D-alanyl-D-alanine-endopeptidase (penicillin-binding protein 4)